MIGCLKVGDGVTVLTDLISAGGEGEARRKVGDAGTAFDESPWGGKRLRNVGERGTCFNSIGEGDGALRRKMGDWGTSLLVGEGVRLRKEGDKVTCFTESILDWWPPEEPCCHMAFLTSFPESAAAWP